MDVPAKYDSAIDGWDALLAGSADVFIGIDSNEDLGIMTGKLFGLSNFIGLSDRDRFELSGASLLEWLQSPASGKEILMRNLAADDEYPDDDSEASADGAVDQQNQPAEFGGANQLGLFDTRDEVSEPQPTPERPQFPTVRIAEIPLTRIEDVDTLVVAAGFEDRAPVSLLRLLDSITPRRIVVIRYGGKFGQGGNADRVVALATRSGAKTEFLELGPQTFTPEILAGAGTVAVDLSALTTPTIFHLVRFALANKHAVTVIHTRAETYYPVDSEIAPILDAERARDHYRLLESLRSVMMGEVPPYSLRPLLQEVVEPSRRRVLIAFASAKHERLLKVLEDRDYDAVEVIAPDGTTARSQLAQIAAQVAVDGVRTGNVTLFGSYELARIYEHLVGQYQSFYVHNGFNVDLGLTGSKLQTAACGALSSTVKLAQAWYVQPQAYNEKTFTRGVGPTRVFRITRAEVGGGG